MKKIILIIVVMLVAAWLALNWVQDQPYFSNPFADAAVAEKLKEDTGRALESGRDAVNKGVDSVKESMK